MGKPIWQFLEYVDERGGFPFSSWKRSLPDAAQAEIDARLELISTVRQLKRPLVATEGEGIIKIRLKSKNIQYRLLACYGPKRGDIALLVGVEEHDNRIPDGAFKEAKKRRATVLKDAKRSRKHE